MVRVCSSYSLLSSSKLADTVSTAEVQGLVSGPDPDSTYGICHSAEPATRQLGKLPQNDGLVPPA